MALFDSLISKVANQNGLGNSVVGSLVSGLLGLIANNSTGGFNGFLDLFRNAGLGSTVDSWIKQGDNTPLEVSQVESSFGSSVLNSILGSSGLSKAVALPVLANLIPAIVDKLTPNGVVPSQSNVVSTIGSYLTRDKEAKAAYVSERAAAGSGSILRWLIPLLLLGLLLVLGFWFCGRGTTPVANVNVNTNVGRANANVNVARAVDSSFRLVAKDGKYVVSGVVPDQATFDSIKAKLAEMYGAGNVDLSGLTISAAAKPFAAGWWDNFVKLLPNLKDWKNGTIAFAGNAVTEAAGLPDPAMAQMKSLFSGWTMPDVAGTAANAARALTELVLPDGTKLQAYPGGIEDQMIKFVQSDELKNATNDQLKDKWFNFDDLNFKFGTTELEPTSKRQLDNIAAILKANPNVKIKVGGYTDKKGDDAANLKLSDGRAKAVQAALNKAGVGAQVPEAEGYGEKFATVDENASDEARKVDRRTSIRFLK